ncbi:MAG: LPS export ABC transporter permease LptG [Pseudomonadota bacterium]
MLRLERYITQSVLWAILLVLMVVVGLDAVSALVDEAEDSSETYGFAQIGYYILLTMPDRFYEFIGPAALVGCMLGLGNLASSSELVVMRAAGVSTARLTWIAMKPAFIVAALGFVIGEYVAPRSEQAAQTYRALAQQKPGGYASDGGVWNREGNTFLNFNAVEKQGIAHGLVLFQFDEKGELQSALRANRAEFRGDHWMMESVQRTTFSSWETQRTRHKTLRWNTAITPDLLSIEMVMPEQLSIADLYRYSNYLAGQGQDSDDYQLALWKKLLQPLAVSGLVLVAISFIFGPLRDGTMGFRIFAGVVVGITFRTLQDLLGPASLVFGFSPLYAALVPIAVCVAAGFLLLSRAR